MCGHWEASSGRGGIVSLGFSALERAVMEAGAQVSPVRRGQLPWPCIPGPGQLRGCQLWKRGMQILQPIQDMADPWEASHRKWVQRLQPDSIGHDWDLTGQPWKRKQRILGTPGPIQSENGRPWKERVQVLQHDSPWTLWPRRSQPLKRMLHHLLLVSPGLCWACRGH